MHQMITISDDLYQRLAAIADRRGTTIGHLAEWMADAETAADEPLSDAELDACPLMQALGMLAFDAPGWADGHDAAIADEVFFRSPG